MSKKIDPKDLIPKEATFTISTGAVLVLNPCTVEDYSWIGERFGPRGTMLGIPDLMRVSMIVYRLLKDKSAFPRSTVTDYNDDGDQIEVNLKGYEVLARALKGVPDLSLAVDAMMTAMGTEKAVEGDKAESQEGAEKKDLSVSPSVSTS